MGRKELQVGGIYRVEKKRASVGFAIRTVEFVKPVGRLGGWLTARITASQPFLWHTHEGLMDYTPKDKTKNVPVVFSFLVGFVGGYDSNKHNCLDIHDRPIVMRSSGDCASMELELFSIFEVKCTASWLTLSDRQKSSLAKKRSTSWYGTR